MTTLIICAAILLIIIIALAILSRPKKNWPGAPYPYASRDPETGFPYPPSPELKKELEEEQKRRIELIRAGGVEALNAYLKIMN